ncbi:MAG: DUF1292 domain-containing protein [Clostridia bacterium]|nr:DUF1292 domain-containing protein [Clostridia bacterium]
MEENLPTDIVTLVDDEGVEREFEVLDCIIIEDSKRKFYALMPNFELEDADLDDDEVTYFIFEMIEEDGEEQLVEVEDDDLLDELSKQFEERLTDH